MHCTINDTDVSNGTGTTPTVEILSAVSCSLSILGACVIFMTYILLPEIRNTTRKLVTCLTIADLFTALGMVVVYLEHMIDQREYSHAVALFENMIGRNPEERHTIGTSFWCWIKCKPEDTDKTLLYMFLTGKAWELQCYIYTAGLYWLLKLRLHIVFRHQSLHGIHEDLREDDQNFLYVWLVLLATRVWGTIRFFIREVPDSGNVSGEMDKVDNVLKYIQAVGDPSQAFCNCILFCFLETW
ncbi:hypothetical protein MAR_005306 [Mya arenaria]|uniref:Uncharacterized protein n=1 Tax=Mya arenaria TaxID=6604 RepID=A0ABY7F301_MYAAR|nr:hypothetical protein MAR_005306 [Mya arenaria]